MRSALFGMVLDSAFYRLVVRTVSLFVLTECRKASQDKDYVHETHYENEDPYGNLEFWIWHVCNLLRNISTVKPQEAFNGTTLKLKQDLIEETGHAYGGI